MPRPHRTALMPVGTVIEHDGDTYTKTQRSSRNPFPWTDDFGGEWGDEKMAELIAEGAQVDEEPAL